MRPVHLPVGRARALPGRPRALAGAQLDRVHRGAGRDVEQGQRVAGLDVRVGAGLHGRADLEADGGDDVRLRAVHVVQQRFNLGVEEK